MLWRNYKILLTLGFLGLFIAVGFSASSQGILAPPKQFDFAGEIEKFGCWVVRVVVVVMVVVLIIAGVQFFTAQGDATKVGDAKKNFYWVLVGLLVIIGTNVIIATISGALGGPAQFFGLNCSPPPRQPPPGIPI
jgi:hypothetical protein